MWTLWNWPVKFCLCVIQNTWWLVHSFSWFSPRILIWLTSYKKWLKLNWIENFVLRKQLKKNEFTIKPSYHGIVTGCWSQSKSKPHSLISLRWKFQLPIYHSFREIKFEKDLMGKSRLKTTEVETFLFASQTFPRSLKHVKITKTTNFWATEHYNTSLKRSWKTLFNGNFFGNIDWKYYHLKPKSKQTNLESWYVNEKFLIFMTY